MRHIHAATGDAVEGAAAVGHAAILSGRVRVQPGTLCVLSGRNVAPETLARVMEGQSQ